MLLYSELTYNEEAQKSVYMDYAKEYGYNARGLGWHNETSQKRRFGVLLDGLGAKTGSLLDVGCGFGDLYDFISQRGLLYKYVGIDMIDEFVKEAKARAPKAMFTKAHIAKTSLGVKFDFVLSSGIFAYADMSIFEQTLNAMWAHANRVMTFNILVDIHSIGFFRISLKEALSVCAKLNPKKVTYKDGYLDSDTTFWLYK